jgi:hypothetical protein
VNTGNSIKKTKSPTVEVRLSEQQGADGCLRSSIVMFSRPSGRAFDDSVCILYVGQLRELMEVCVSLYVGASQAE